MSKIVKLKSTGTGYSLIVGGETVKTGLPSVSLALRWLRNNYGRKFQESLVSSTAKDGSRLVGRKNPKKRKPSKRRNMSQGITRGTGPTRVFHPIRSAPDYDPSLLRDSEGKKARKQKKQKKRGLKAIAKKRSLKTKTATKKRKAKKAVSLFGKKALPTSRRNPTIFQVRVDGNVKHVVSDKKQAQRLAARLRGIEGKGRVTVTTSHQGYAYRADVQTRDNPKATAKKAKRKASSTKAKRSIPAAFKAAAERAKAMTPAQRAAWAKKMQAARKAKQKLKR